MNYKSTSTCGVKYVGRVETVIKDSFTQNSVGKNINIDGKEFMVKSIFKRGNIPDNMIRLNVTNKWWEEYLKMKEKIIKNGL